jgi:peptide/nickel transport system ATP-binding protein
MTVLRTEGLRVTARMGGVEVAALDGLSLSIAPGKVLGLVGESGAGKSMLGRAIAQLLPPGFAVSAGKLEFAGHDLVAMAPGRRRDLLGRQIGFIPQEPLSALNPVRSIGSQFAEHLRRLGVTDWRATAVAALASVQLPDVLDRFPHQLSGGMCQRVLIAMAFASNPALVVADEPTTALDVTIQARIVALMRDLQIAHNTAVLFITHDLRLAAQVCDEIAVLYAGRVVEHGPAASVLAQPLHPYTKCLLLAAPAISGPRQALYALPDQMPGLRALAAMSGCRFAPRCPLARDTCRDAVPALTGDAHKIACPHIAEIDAIVVPKLAPVSAAATGETLISVAGLGKVFRGRFWRKPTVAVRDVSFSISAGEFVGVVGESGSGKSTLARLLMGLELKSAGCISLAGQDVGGWGKAARQLRLRTAQMVFQDPQSALNPRRRVGAIVTQALEAAGIGAAERRARAADILADLGMPAELADRAPAQLSGGQRQRVNIGRALCLVPKLLVADEIVSGLDVSVQAQLLALLAQLRAEHGFALLLISHDLAVVRYLCERVMVMRNGEVVEAGRTDEVFANPQHPYTKELLASVPA